MGCKYQGWVIYRDQNFDDKGQEIRRSISIKGVARLRQPAVVLAINS
jgi:predicted transcriptional regulator